MVDLMCCIICCVVNVGKWVWIRVVRLLMIGVV